MARRVPPGIARWVGVSACVWLGFLPAAAAQQVNPGPAYATRAMLEQQLSEKGSGDAARLTRARLDSGDFRPGDRILLLVQGEQELSDTFAVGMATELTLPQVGVVPLAGVLRAELPARLKQALARYLLAPVVEVRCLIRVGIEGEVTHPGFYAIPPETPVMDAMTVAGGLTRDAKFEDVRVERGGIVIMSGRTLETAVRSGRTFDALNLRAGDRIFIPKKGDLERTVRIIAVILTIPISIYAITQIIK